MRLALKAGASLQGRMKLARLLSLPEDEAEDLARSLEADPFFGRLCRVGALRRAPLPAAALTARRMAGRSLCAPSEGLGELLDGRSDLVRLMRRLGHERFEACFLAEDAGTDAERCKKSGLDLAQVRALRSFVDRLYIRGEFEPVAAAPAKVFSTVAGYSIRAGKAELKFFHRDLWRVKYLFDEKRLSALPASERERAGRLLYQLQLLDRRKDTLLRVLETLMQAQGPYLKTGDPALRQPLTQRSVASALKVEPSALNRLISNKAVELPWGTEAPMKALLPSAKVLARQTLEALALAQPGDSDEQLRALLARRHHIFLSRRSVAQYRQDLGLGRRGKRAAA